MAVINVAINVDKIDKSRFFQGKTARWLNLVLVETPNSKYGNDYLVKQEQTKEEKAQQIKTPPIGNAKIVDSQSQGNKGNGGGKSTDKGGDDDTDW